MTLPLVVPRAVRHRGRVGCFVFGVHRLRLLETRANGRPAFACYTWDGGAFRPLALQLVTLDGGRVAAVGGFVDSRRFTVFAVPDLLPA